MKVTREKTENSQAFLTVEMEPAEVEEALGKAYQRLVKKANVPGFRKGKAPRTILEQYIGKESLLEDAINNMAPEAAEKAITEQELKVIARPDVEVEKIEPLIFKIVVPLEPTATLGDYKQLKVAQESVEFKEEDVDNAIEQLRHNHATWEVVEREAGYGDLVIIDIESNIGAQPYINQKDAQYEVTKDSQYPMAGFAEKLIGMKKGEAKEFTLQFPADYGRAELAGKDASFKVKLNDVKKEILPELNDEFAKKVNPEFKDIAALRERLSTNYKNAAEERAKVAFEGKVVNAVAEQAKVEFPPVLVEAEIDKMIRDQMRRWQMSEKGMDEYLKNIKKTEKELRDEMSPIATQRIKQSIVLGKVAEQEKIEVSEEEINAEIEGMTKELQKNKEEMEGFFNAPQARQSVANVLATHKTIARLTELAKSPAEQTQEIKEEAKKND